MNELPPANSSNYKWWKPPGSLRVRLGFAGPTILDHPKNPRALRGCECGWKSFNASNARGVGYLCDEHANAIIINGRRWQLHLQHDRQQRTARKLKNRCLKNRWAAGLPLVERYHPERGVRWIMWPLGFALLVLTVPLFGSGFITAFQKPPLLPMSWHILTLVTLGIVLLMFLGMSWLAFWMGWKLGLPIAEKVVYSKNGITAFARDDKAHDVSWHRVNSIKRDLSHCVLDVDTIEPIRIRHGHVSRMVLQEKYDEMHPQRCQPELTDKSGCIAKSLLWRTTRWCFVAAVIAGALGYFVQSSGYGIPGRSAWTQALAGVAAPLTIAAMLWTLGYVLPKLSKTFAPHCNRMRRTRRARRRA